MTDEPDLDPRALALIDLIRRIVEVGAGLDPTTALYRVAETLVDGELCKHCGRPTGVELSPDGMPLDDVVCWYQYDPELATFRRGCE